MLLEDCLSNLNEIEARILKIVLRDKELLQRNLDYKTKMNLIGLNNTNKCLIYLKKQLNIIKNHKLSYIGYN